MGKRLSKDDWTAAALQALAKDGPKAVAIEPLATRLNATKGSAYWHFTNREALLRAALERWESEETERVIVIVESQPDAKAKLATLFGTAMRLGGADAVELALISAGNDPIVAPILKRVTDRRLGYITQLFQDHGFNREDAIRRARWAYAIYIGQSQLIRASSIRLPRSKARREEDIADLLAILLH